MSPSPEIKRACDRCRRRKIKCDSTTPCSYCRISSQTCSYNLPVAKRGPKGPRTRRHDTSQPNFAEISTAEDPSRFGERGLDAFTILGRLQRELLEAIQSEVPGIPVVTVAHHCISVHFQRSFPILHEPSLREDAAYFFSADASAGLQHTTKDALALMRSFAVLTAFCAAQSFLYSKSTIPYGAAVGPKFLTAARSMLREYEDDDLRDPNATSLQVRMLLSRSVQQYNGDSSLSWHLVSEACLIARRMRLYSEAAVCQYAPLEATMLRNAFWMLHLADASAICMQNRAVVLYEPLFDAEMDLAELGFNQVPLLKGDNSSVPGEFEIGLSKCFHKVRRTWESVAHLMIAVRAFARTNRDNIQPELCIDSAEFRRITQMYSQFDGALDDIPASLQPSIILSEAVAEDERPSYISQRYRLLSAYYYGKLIIIHECRHLGLAFILGFRDDDLTIHSEEINVARDFIHNLQSIQFHYLVELGEPGVEVMRAVGSILLSISQKSENSLTRQRALSQLNVLLDILARLDSQASEILTSQLSLA
ncbi:hypothetical protein FDECE_9041 [Fusarium decemcellulare]|nr:hypothetical protein FDECE_9041 [Fusarium decemcellulare]